MPHPTEPQDSAAAPRHSSLPTFLAAWLCAATGLGCPAAQVKPEPADCPTEAEEAMFQELRMDTGQAVWALLDVNQPYPPTEMNVGLFQEGPLVGRVRLGNGLLVEGTLLYGYLWTGPGLLDEHGREAVFGRYTKAVLPDGKTYPVCLALGSTWGSMDRVPGSKPGTVQLPRDHGMVPVRRWR